MTEISAIGVQLRQHRKNRGMSQLALAHSADSTPRYISFIETGRSRPGRNVILRIADALNLTLRDSNALLVSAGLPVAFEEKPLDDAELEPIRRIIKQVLSKHDPFPAWAIGPGLKFLDSNLGAENVFPGLVGMEPRAMIDMWCAPSDFFSDEERSYVVFQTLNGLREEAFHYPHPDLPDLIKQVESYAVDFDEPPIISDSPVMCPTLMVDGKQVRTLSTVMRFDKVVNVTMSEIRIELVFPADDESEAILRGIKSLKNDTMRQ